MKTILVTGANGQLGNEMRKIAEKDSNHIYLFTDIQELDICDARSVSLYVKDNKVDFIVNCAAYTAVDKAEDDPALCYQLNRDAVGNLGKAAFENGAAIVHISTDYVYSGVNYKPYNENDPTAPCSVYGKSKQEGEEILLRVCPASVILRTSWLYSTFGNNFVKTMIRLGQEKPEISVIFDQIGTPTYGADLAEVIAKIISADKFIPGIYNYSNEGVCSWYDFTKTIHRISNITNCRVKPIEGSEYPAKATRPFYSVMNKKKIKDTYSISIPHWEESLCRCIKELMK